MATGNGRPGGGPGGDPGRPDGGLRARVLGCEIRERRRQLGLTASELARRAGVSASFLSEIEKGRKSPSLGTLDRLAGQLGIGRGALLPPSEVHLHGAGLPKRLGLARERASLTRTRLAELAGVTPGMVTQLESGAASPSLDTLERLAAALGVSPCHLLVDDPDLETVLAGLTPEARHALLDPDVQALLQSVVGLDRRCFVLALEVVRAIRRHCPGAGAGRTPESP